MRRAVIAEQATRENVDAPGDGMAVFGQCRRTEWGLVGRTLGYRTGTDVVRPIRRLNLGDGRRDADGIGNPVAIDVVAGDQPVLDLAV